MSTFRTWTRRAALFVAACLVLTLGAAPMLVSGADHLDAPALGGLTNAAGEFAPHSEHGNRDINDIYVFQGANASRTVLVMTTNPAINLFGGTFGTNVRYILNVDRNGDAVQDVAYVVRFSKSDDGDDDAATAGGASAKLCYTVTRYTGSDARSLRNGTKLGEGRTDRTINLKNNSKAFAGVRSDPFFFDLTGFVGSVSGIGSDRLGQDPTDFFAALNTNAIVLEVPDGQLGTQIGVWGQTTHWNGSRWAPGDQMGRPAINTVFNPSADKNAFNRTEPSRQPTAMGGKFRTNVINVLKAFSAGDSEGAYSDAEAGGLADVLLPDVITYDTATAAVGPLNGRALADDVIDAELNIVTGGFKFAGRDAVGAITGDGVGPHGDYQSTFPYLGVPH